MKPAYALNSEEKERALFYFDPEWYRESYGLDEEDDSLLATRFLETEIWEGRDPGPLFSSAAYRAINSNFSQAEIPAFVHYVRWGCFERRRPNPVFVPAVYEYHQPDALRDVADLFAHFIAHVRKGAMPTFSRIIPVNWHLDIPTEISGEAAITRLFAPHVSLVGLLPKCCFRPVFYRKHAHALEWENELYDYLTTGWRNGIDPHPLFDTQFYLELLEKSETFMHNVFEHISPLEHYLANWATAPAASPFFDAKYFNHNCSAVDGDAVRKYANPFEAFCALDPAFRTVSPHRKVNYAALGHARQDNIINHANKRFDAEHFIAFISALRLSAQSRKTSAGKPKVSVLVLNYNNLEHTIQAVFCALCNTGDVACEFLVLDNGSGNWDVHQMERYLSPFDNVRVIPSKKNTFFGEGNNLLIDEARGEYLFFLNNDAYLGKSTITELVRIMDENETCGLAGATLLFPDGQIQEEGGTALDCGQVVQHSKHLPVAEFILRRKPEQGLRDVDYVSAAVSLVRTETIRKIGGFDYIYEPLFFEDTDLCRRIRAHGYKILVSRETFAVHLENTSTKEFLANKFMDQIRSNRLKYATRWLRSGDTRIPRSESNLDRFEIVSTGKPRAVVYTPFPLLVGGGERYILSVAAALSKDYDLTFTTEDITSRTRLAFVMDDLKISGQFGLSTFSGLDPREPVDTFVVIGNEIIPPVKGIGKHNIYHCQFPFPLHNVELRNPHLLDAYDCIVVNSVFTQAAVEEQLERRRLKKLPVHVITPPVDTNRDKAQAGEKSVAGQSLHVANVGRFITAGHQKRQDIVLEILEAVQPHGVRATGSILGGLSANEGDIAYFNSLKNRATADVAVESNVSRQRIRDALMRADIYIHATGFGLSPTLQAPYLEHFGITIVEAMSYGCVPLVFDGGGPAEIVRDSGVGYTFKTVHEAADRMLQFNALPAEERQRLAQKAFEAAQAYSEEQFVKSWRELGKN